QLLGEAADRPGQSAHPGAEWRKALLRIWTTVTAVVNVEDAFMGRSPAHVIKIAPFAIINRELCRGRGVLDQSIEQRNFAISLPHQHVTEPMRERERSQRPDRIDKQRMRSIEGVNKSAARIQLSPAR